MTEARHASDVEQLRCQRTSTSSTGASGRRRSSTRPTDYRAFLDVLRRGPRAASSAAAGVLRAGQPLAPRRGSEGHDGLSRFMHWVTSTHAVRWHHRATPSGRAPSTRAGSSPARPSRRRRNLVRVCRYVERNALRRGLVQRAQDWPWCSLADASVRSRLPLDSAPFLCLRRWVEHVDRPCRRRAISQQASQLAEDPRPDLVPKRRQICGKKVRPLTSLDRDTTPVHRPREATQEWHRRRRATRSAPGPRPC